MLFSANQADSRLFKISAYILHGTEMSEIGRYVSGKRGSVLGLGIGMMTLVCHSSGTWPSWKQYLIMVYKSSMLLSFLKISLCISSIPTDLPSLAQKLRL